MSIPSDDELEMFRRHAAIMRERYPGIDNTVIATIDALRNYITVFENFTLDGDEPGETIRIELVPDQHLAWVREILENLEDFQLNRHLSGIIKQ